MDSARWLVDLASKAAAKRIVLNGSFTTDKPEPNDVDCVVLVGVDFDFENEIAEEIMNRPFISGRFARRRRGVNRLGFVAPQRLRPSSERRRNAS